MIPFTIIKRIFTEAPHIGGTAVLMPLAGVGVIGLSIIGAILLIIAIYVYLLNSMKRLQEYSTDFSTANSLIRIRYIWGLVLIIIGIITLILIIGIFLLIIASHS